MEKWVIETDSFEESNTNEKSNKIFARSKGSKPEKSGSGCQQYDLARLASKLANENVFGSLKQIWNNEICATSFFILCVIFGNAFVTTLLLLSMCCCCCRK